MKVQDETKLVNYIYNKMVIKNLYTTFVQVIRFTIISIKIFT